VLASKVKEKLKRREVSLGTWMSMGHPSIAEILATAGYDWVVIDNEHSAMSFPQIQNLIMSWQK
jgi:2-dehydro-3-deoxyglucarate aldolase